MKFHQLELSDREAMQAVTLPSGRRNCNYTFANLAGWKFLFHTEVCVLENAVVLRYTFDGQRAYMVCTSEALSLELIEALFDDSNGSLILIGLEDSQVAQLSIFNSQLSINIEPVRNQYDYIYRRTDLATLHGRHLDGKRNHIHRFRAEYPDFEYRPLTPEFFDECRRLTGIWQEEKKQNVNDNENKIEIIDAEHRVMETIFSNWEALGMTGGSIFVDGRMMAFTYGGSVTVTAPITSVAVSGTTLGDVAFTAKVDGTGDAISPTSHDATGASFTGLNVAAGHSLVVYRNGTVWFTITAQDSGGDNE